MSRGRSVLSILAVLALLAAGTWSLAVPAAAFEPGTGQAEGRACAVGTESPLTEPLADLETETGQPDDPRIVGLKPNTPVAGNEGEYVVLESASPVNLSGWTIADEHREATLPPVTIDGPAAFSRDPDTAREFTELEVYALEGSLRLAQDGDRLTVLDANETVVDTVGYERAPAGQRWHRVGSRFGTDPDWQPGSDGERPELERPMAASVTAVGADRVDGDGVWWPALGSCEPIHRTVPVAVEAFVLPDAPDRAIDVIATAEERVLLGGYTFADEAVTDALLAAIDRGVDVQLLLEASPVGGTPAESRPLLDELDAAGATVTVVGGPDARYAYHHPKYLVADDRVMVLTENWKASGTGGASSRGWGVLAEDPRLADELADRFATDAAGLDVTPWSAHREAATFVEDDPPDRSFDAEHEPARVEGEEIEAVELLLAPDNLAPRVIELIDGADEEVLIKQARIADRDLPALRAAIAAAERGVTVRVLLDDSWYVREDNAAIEEALTARAEREDLDLEVRRAGGGDRFQKIHAKGLVVDREVAVVGSANWNNASMTTNREVALAVHGPAVAGFYAGVFEGDWAAASGAGGSVEHWRVPALLVVVMAGGLWLVAEVARRTLSFARPAASHSRDARPGAPPPSSERERR